MDPAEKWMFAPLAGLSSLQRLRLSMSFGLQAAENWGWLQALRRLTSVYLYNHSTL